MQHGAVRLRVTLLSTVVLGSVTNTTKYPLVWLPCPGTGERPMQCKVQSELKLHYPVLGSVTTLHTTVVVSREEKHPAISSTYQQTAG